MRLWRRPVRVMPRWWQVWMIFWRCVEGIVIRRTFEVKSVKEGREGGFPVQDAGGGMVDRPVRKGRVWDGGGN